MSGGKLLGLGKRILEVAEQRSWENTLEQGCGDWKNRWNSQGRGEGESPGHRVCLGEEGAGLSRGQDWRGWKGGAAGLEAGQEQSQRVPGTARAAGNSAEQGSL